MYQASLPEANTNTSPIKNQLPPYSPSSRVAATLHPTVMARSKTNGALRSGNGHAVKAEDGSIRSGVNGQKTIQEKNASTRTDYSRWRLLDERGRQTWHYLEDDEDVKEWPQSTADKYYLGLPTVCMPFGIHRLFAKACRIFPIFLLPKPLSMRSRTVSNSSNSYNCLLATGDANMEDLCFYSQGLSSPGS